MKFKFRLLPGLALVMFASMGTLSASEFVYCPENTCWEFKEKCSIHRELSVAEKIQVIRGYAQNTLQEVVAAQKQDPKNPVLAEIARQSREILNNVPKD